MKYVVFEKEGSSTKYCVFAGEALPPWATNIAYVDSLPDSEE